MNNKVVISFTVVIIFLMIFIPTFNKVKEDKTNSYLTVLKNKIIYAAQECWNHDLCKNDKLTIKELYNSGYLATPQVNPKTKENLNEDSYIVRNNNELTVTIVD